MAEPVLKKGSNDPAVRGVTCGDNQAVIGMIGRSGGYVEALGLICGPRPVATGPVVAQPSPGPLPKPDATLNQRDQRASSPVETGVDRPGQDYKNFNVGASIAGFDPCKSACEADANCKAWNLRQAWRAGSSSEMLVKVGCASVKTERMLRLGGESG